MKPINFAQANQMLGAPEGWDKDANGECQSLPVMNNGQCIVSCWKPSDEELTELNKGGAVMLMIYGANQPPIQIVAAAMEETAIPVDEKGSPEEILNKQARAEFESARASKGSTVN